MFLGCGIGGGKVMHLEVTPLAAARDRSCATTVIVITLLTKLNIWVTMSAEAFFFFFGVIKLDPKYLNDSEFPALLSGSAAAE